MFFLNPFKMIRRMAWLAFLLFGTGTAVIVGAVVIITDGLGSGTFVSLPGQPTQPQATVPDVRLGEIVEKRPLLEDVPLPSEVSGDTDVIATNAGLAILLAILLGIVSSTLNNLVRDEEATFRRWFSIPLLKPLFRLVDWGAGQNVQRGCLTLPLILVIFGLYGFIFAFLERGLDLLSPEGLQLVIVMAMSVGLISLAGDVAQRQIAWFWGRAARVGLYPANLAIAVVTTVLSRGLHLSPGIVFGTPGGVDIDLENDPPTHEVFLALATIVAVIVLGGAGWAASAAVESVGDQTLSRSAADFAGPLAQLGLTIGLAIFFVAVETSFFEMVPLSSSLGGQIFRWNPIIWFVIFTPIMFVFAHTLLNPDSDYLRAFEQANVQVLTIVLAVLTLITAALWIYFRVLRREAAPAIQHPAPPIPPPPYARRPAQPPVPPPSSLAPPPSRPAQTRPAQTRPPTSPPPQPYVPPPIIISDNVPPPIIIKDDEPPDDENDLDQTRHHTP